MAAARLKDLILNYCTQSQKGFSNFSNFVKSLNYWKKGSLNFIASRRGMGRTAYILSSLHQLGIVDKVPCAFLSLDSEISNSLIINRFKKNRYWNI